MDIRAMTAEQLADVIGEIARSNKVIIPNWFIPQHLKSMLDGYDARIDEHWQAFADWVKGSERWADRLSEQLPALWLSFLLDRKPA